MPKPLRPRPVLTSVLAGSALLLSVAGCGGGASSSDGTFQAGTAAYPLTCMQHQPNKPGSAYTAGENADTAAILAMLKYYTANRTVTRYCDDRKPTDLDKAWAQLYLASGAEPAAVSHILGQQP